MSSADSPLPILNLPAGMSTSSIFTPPPKSAASFFGGSGVSLKAVPAIVKSTMHTTAKFLIKRLSWEIMDQRSNATTQPSRVSSRLVHLDHPEALRRRTTKLSSPATGS